MGTNGILYVIRTMRADGGAIVFRTTDRAEADRMAALFGADWQIN